MDRKNRKKWLLGIGIVGIVSILAGVLFIGCGIGGIIELLLGTSTPVVCNNFANSGNVEIVALLDAGGIEKLKGIHCEIVWIFLGIALLILSRIAFKIYKRNCIFHECDFFF
jgi:hypothetical protein